MDPLKIILSVDSLRQPLTGIGRYTYELAKGLAEHEEVDDVRLLDRYKWYDRADDLISHGEVPGSPSLTQRISTSIRSKPLLRDLSRGLAPILKTINCIPYRKYIYHSPNYALPIFPGKCVTTIHDLSVIRHPEFHPKERVDHLIGLFPSIIRRADVILTDSEFSRNEIINEFNVTADRVITVPLGVDRRFHKLANYEIDVVLQKYGLKRNHYTLSLGTIEPRKNLERLILSYQTLPKSIKRECPLVLVGNEGWNSEAIHKRMKEASSEGWLKYLKYVVEEDLSAIYSGARLFACVSLYEGFGLPVLEALASGVAVISSRVTSLPEVGGKSVRYIDPFCIESIRTALSELLEDPEQLRVMRDNGILRAKRYTWREAINKTIDAYRL